MSRLTRFLNSLARVLKSHKGSSTIEYVVVISCGIALALLLDQVVASAEVQGLLQQKIMQVITGQNTVVSLDEERAENRESGEQSLEERKDDLFGRPEWMEALISSYRFLEKKVNDGLSEAWETVKDKSLAWLTDEEKSPHQKLKDFMTWLHPLIMANELMKQVSGFDPLGNLTKYITEHPVDSAVTAGFILLSLLQPEIGLAGLIGGAASGSMFAGGLSGIVGWAVFRGMSTWLAGGRIGGWMGRAFLPFAQRLMNIGISGGAAAFADSVVFDWLKGKWPSIKKASIAALIGLTFGFGGVALAHHGQTIVSKINSIPLTNVSVFKDGTASAPKTVGDTAFGSWLKKFSVETGNGVSGSGNKKVKRDDLVPGSSEHKAQRWKEYQENGGQMSYSHWSKLYDGNMGKPTKSHQIVDEYRNTLPWKGSMQVSVKTPYGRRLLDIANEEMKKAIEHKTTIKEGTVGYFSLNERIREEVAKDAYLVKEEDWDITWVFENADASEPLKQALKENGIKIKFENDGD